MATGADGVFAGVAVLLCLITQSLAAPAPDPPCVGTALNNGQVLFRLPLSITKKMTDPTCFAYWSIDERLVASADDYVHPVISATTDTITVDSCPRSLTFRLSCPGIDFDKKLQCSCKSSVPLSSTEGTSSDAHQHKVPYEWLGTVITMHLITL
ncbi:hypothetical protein AOLI_G00043130 [Acnodon oligacanthus]